MKQELIHRTEEFLKEKFSKSETLATDPAACAYRLEHSYRVANIAKSIAEAEGFDVTCAVVAGLLHDVAYCEEMPDREAWKNHGRRSAAIARPFLQELGLSAEEIHEICYGIAIHVDDEADFPGQRTAFAETVGDADNIDRFDAYRIYETLQTVGFSKMTLAEKQDQVSSMLSRLNSLREMKLGTAAAKILWQQRLDDYIAFYEKLRDQLNHSTAVL